MSEHLITFRPEMMRALLAGRKTQTRRVVAPGNSLLDGHAVTARLKSIVWPLMEWRRAGVGVDEDSLYVPYPPDDIEVQPRIQPGDTLRVKEALAPGQYRSASPYQLLSIRDWRSILYEADGAQALAKPSGLPPADDLRNYWRWKVKRLAAMYMPLVFSRRTLRVTGVRIGHVQDITADDAIAEGVVDREQYAALWDSINGKTPGCAWGDNPWTWAYDFGIQED